jgi:membrane protease YdiL (CAAX protease family)
MRSPLRKAAAALGLGYLCALIWVIAADVVFENRVPLEHVEFHGLYPLSLAASAAVMAFTFDRSFRDLALRRPRLRDLALAASLAIASVLLAFAINLALNLTQLKPDAQLKASEVVVGFPLMLVLSFGEEVMWRGYLYTQLRRRLSFNLTALSIGLVWALWHYPVIVHTRFLYADLSPAHALSALTIMTCTSSFLACWLRERGDSVWPAIVWHAALNYTSFTFVIPVEADVDEHSRYFRLDTGVGFLAIYALSALLIAFRAHSRRG